MEAEAEHYCADQVRRFDHDRYLCALFAPASARADILALYAFNVEVSRIRDAVREPMMGQIRLQWWREVIESAPGGGTHQHPVALALAAVIRARGLPLEPFERLLTAREFDLSEEPPEDLAALESYAEATSATLIDQALTVLGAQGDAAREAGRHVGVAWALTGLLRAVPFHAARRQIFLPRDLSRTAGLDPESLVEGRPGSALQPVAARVAEAAREHLRTARAVRREVPRGAVPALLPAVLADRYLDRLERSGFSLFDARLQQPAGDRAMRLLWAALRGRY